MWTNFSWFFNQTNQISAWLIFRLSTNSTVSGLLPPKCEHPINQISTKNGWQPKHVPCTVSARQQLVLLTICASYFDQSNTHWGIKTNDKLLREQPCCWPKCVTSPVKKNKLTNFLCTRCMTTKVECSLHCMHLDTLNKNMNTHPMKSVLHIPGYATDKNQ